MTLLRQVSDRLDNKGKPYLDYYLVLEYGGKNYLVRVRPQFARDYSLLFNNAIDVPKGECLEKYF